MAGVVTVLLEKEIRTIVREESQSAVDEAVSVLCQIIKHKEFVTNKEAADITGRSVSQLDNLSNSGQIDFYMNVNRVLFKYTDLIDWIKAGHVVATKPRNAA